MDLRRQCINENWPKIPPYNIEEYRQHYFYSGFDKLAARFTESHAEANDRRKAGFAGQGASDLRRGEIRDYLPHATAVRMRDFITFTLKLEGLAPDFQID